MRFPSIKNVAARLREINKTVSTEHNSDPDEGVDVRLCIDDDGSWCVHWGLVDYDPDHAPMCGASSVPGDNRRFNSKEIARDLLEQCKDQFAMNEGE